MGYWGYEATASDSALDYLARVTEHLEKMWDEAKGYGQKMAIVYILTEAPVVDVTDYRGLKEKCAKYLQDYADPSLTTIEPGGFVAAMVQRHQ